MHQGLVRKRTLRNAKGYRVLNFSFFLFHPLLFLCRLLAIVSSKLSRSPARPNLEIIDYSGHPFDLLCEGRRPLFHGLTVDRTAKTHSASAGVDVNGC